MKLDRRYNLTLWAAFGCIGLLVLAIFVWQVNRLHEEVWHQIEGRLQRHHQVIEAVLRSCADELEALRAVALDAPRTDAPVWPQASAGGYHLDEIAQPDRWGNLIGQGPLQPLGSAHREDLYRALTLAPWFSAIPFKQPAIAESKYVSPHGFVLVHPWRASKHFDPHRVSWDRDETLSRRWGLAYFAGQDKGLLVPLAAPVPLPSGHVSWVQLDLSLDHLNRLHQAIDLAHGQVWLINPQGQVLAHPQLHAQGLSTRSAPMQALPEWPDSQRITDHDHWRYRLPFRAAPWQMVYEVDQRALWWRIWWQQSTTLAEVLLAMLALMGLAHLLTRREFVQPALKLVHFLGHSSRHDQVSIPAVPLAWRPWFERVRSMMQESRQLLAVEQELRIAAQMQQAILPPDWPADDRHALIGLMKPARHVGGDFYDHLRLADGSLSLIVADVSGKGVGAALFGMVCKTHYRALAEQYGTDPARLLSGINRALCVSNPQCMFVTAWCGHYQPASGVLRWSGAGHPPALLRRAQGPCQWLSDAQGLALGLVEDSPYPLHEGGLSAGDQLMIYTDGVTEAINAQQEEFGSQRLLAVAGALGYDDPWLQALMQAVADFVAGEEPFDDITCLVLTNSTQSP